jgi:peptidyl-prolyl cis-trans isomerase A (cyclophilin A)
VLRVALLAVVLALVAAASAGGSASFHAPAHYKVAFKTTKGRFVVSVNRSLAPRGADRFYTLARAQYYDGATFFRVVKGFVVQFGIAADPAVSQAWANANILDDPVRASNVPGTMTFADAGPNTRGTQVFVNLGNNAFLDSRGFAPFGRVTTGMAIVGKLYSGYGEKPGADQAQITQYGNAFLKKHFPKLDRILTARIVSP